MKQRYLKEIFAKFYVWNEKYILGLTVRQFERLERCPFCELINPGKWWEPWPECRVCFGRGRVPSRMVPVLLNTIEYQKSLRDGGTHISAHWKRDKRSDARCTEVMPDDVLTVEETPVVQYN